MASGTGLFALQAMDWDSAIAAEMGVPLEALPELCDYASCQPLCARAASMLGLKQGIPVVTAHPDGAMNQIGDDAFCWNERRASHDFSASRCARSAVALVLLCAGQLPYGRRYKRLCELC